MKKIIFGVIFLLGISILIMNFKIIQFDRTNYISKNFTQPEYNFSFDGKQQQFYPNMRYQYKEISYRIENCTISKKNDFVRAIEIISNETILSFYKVFEDEEILVTCSEKERIEEGVFIAGEGGPKNITISGNNHIIFSGSVHLIKKSECFNPNVAIHELLHALGFDHSENKNNIMYNFSYCDQEIGEDIIEEINRIYSQEPLADLKITQANAIIEKGYLNASFEIKNEGIIDSFKSKMNISINNKEIKEIDISEMKIGTGISVSLSNIKIKERNIENVSFFIQTEQKEIDKENNLLVLKMNKYEELN